MAAPRSRAALCRNVARSDLNFRMELQNNQIGLQFGESSFGRTESALSRQSAQLRFERTMSGGWVAYSNKVALAPGSCRNLELDVENSRIFEQESFRANLRVSQPFDCSDLPLSNDQFGMICTPVR